MPEFDHTVVKPVLVYWHCRTYWPISDGPICQMEHETPVYDDRPRKGRRRLVWMCEGGDGGIAYLSHRDFLEHDEEGCYADF